MFNSVLCNIGDKEEISVGVQISCFIDSISLETIFKSEFLIIQPAIQNKSVLSS